MIKLFPDSELYAEDQTGVSGVYDLELPHGNRWLQPKAQIFVKLPSKLPRQPGWLRLVLGGPTWVGPAWVVVRVDGKFSSALEILDYAEHFVPLPDHLQACEPGACVAVTLETLTDCSGGPDSRNLAVALYGGDVVSAAYEAGQKPAADITSQVDVLLGNPRFLNEVRRLSEHGHSAVALEVGGGRGVLSALIAALGSAEVWCADMMEYSAPGARAPEQLRGIVDRNQGYVSQAFGLDTKRLVESTQRVHHCTVDAERLLFKDAMFDLVFSLNAFEHIGSPKLALAEIQRVLKPGGVAFIQFSPIYFSDGGSHLPDQGLLPIPWVQLLYTRDEIVEMVEQRGHPANRVNEILDSLNGKSASYYRDIFSNSELEVLHMEEIKGTVIPSAEDSGEYTQVRALFPAEDLLILGFRVALRKPQSLTAAISAEG